MAEEETWRPLGVDTDGQVAECDALHDGVPKWMRSAYWAWVKVTVTVKKRTAGSRYQTRSVVEMLAVALTEEMCQTLRIALPDLRKDVVSFTTGKEQLSTALAVLAKHSALQIAGYLLAHGGHAEPNKLDDLLGRAKSLWTIGTRAGKPCLVRRVPLGVQLRRVALFRVGFP